MLHKLLSGVIFFLNVWYNIENSISGKCLYLVNLPKHGTISKPVLSICSNAKTVTLFTCSSGPKEGVALANGVVVNGGVKKNNENKRRVTRMILVVIAVFAVCWSPLQLVLVLDRFGAYDITSTAHHIFKVNISLHKSVYQKGQS